MCILAGVFFADGTDRENCYYAESVYYDLIKGEEVSFTDLFYEGIDVDEAMYDLLTSHPLSFYSYDFYHAPVTFTDITKLVSTDHFAMSFDRLYFNYNNPFLCVGEIYDISLDKEYLCINEPDPMEGIFEEDHYVKMSFDSTHLYPIYEYINVGEDYSMRVKVLDETDEYGERNKKINDAVRKYVSETYSVDKVTEKFLADGSTMEEIENWRLLQFYYDHSFSLGGFSDAFVVLASDKAELMFDGKTGDVIEIIDLLKDGWQNNIIIGKADEYRSSGGRQHTPEESAAIEKNILPEHAKFISFSNWAIRYGIPIDGKSYLPLAFECADSGLAIAVYVDSDYVKGFAD